MKDKEDKEVDSEARPMKDETFGEYRCANWQLFKIKLKSLLDVIKQIQQEVF